VIVLVGGGGIGGCSTGDAFFPNRRSRFPRVFDRDRFGVGGGSAVSDVGVVAFVWTGVSLPFVGLIDEIELASVGWSWSCRLLVSSRLLGEGDRDRLLHRCDIPLGLALPYGSFPLEPVLPNLPRSYEVLLPLSDINSDLTAKVDTVIFGVLGAELSFSTIVVEQAFSRRVGSSVISTGIGETDIVVVVMLDLDGEI